MSDNSGKYKDVFQKILSSENVLITFHTSPDGDCTGSAFALYYTLISMNKKVLIFSSEPLPFNCRFLNRDNVVRDTLDTDKRFDLTFVLDLSEEKRIMKGIDISNRSIFGYVINIDHHITGKGVGDLIIQEPDAASTGEIVFRILRHNDVKLNKDIASALYTAIITDTGGFKYSSTTAELFEMAAYLVRSGVSPWGIAEKIYESEPKERVLLLGSTLSTLRFAADGRVAYMFITLDTLKKYGATDDMTDQFVNYARSIEGVLVGALFREIPNGRIKVSLRSKGDLDVATFSLKFGGGGHKNAAGILLSERIEDAISKIISALTEYIG